MSETVASLDLPELVAKFGMDGLRDSGNQDSERTKRVRVDGGTKTSDVQRRTLAFGWAIAGTHLSRTDTDRC